MAARRGGHRRRSTVETCSLMTLAALPMAKHEHTRLVTTGGEDSKLLFARSCVLGGLDGRGVVCRGRCPLSGDINAQLVHWPAATTYSKFTAQAHGNKK